MKKKHAPRDTQLMVNILPLILLILSACSTRPVAEDMTTTTANNIVNPKSAANVFKSNRMDQDPVNVVYFIPTDLVDAYKKDSNKITRRISKIMLFEQEWYKKQMELNGYQDKTFALYTKANNSLVMILPVYGKKASTEYSGNKEAKGDIEAYFQKNPSLKGGEHTMVFSDKDSGFNNATPERMAFCRSDDDFTIIETGQFLDDLELLHWGTAGGCIHELGHAFNSPHFAHRASENPGRSMMGGGGANLYNSGKDLNSVFLVPASAAIFDVSEAFNKNNDGIDYYGKEPTINLTSYSIKKDNGIRATRAQFTFTSDVTPKYVYTAMDAEPSTVNDDYDKVSFSAKVDPTGNPNEYKAEVVMPYGEFFDGYSSSSKIDNDIEFSVDVLSENGFRTVVLSYDFTTSSATEPEPDDNINKELIKLSDRSEWSVTASSTNHGDPTGQGADKMVDGDSTSFWFSDFPHHFEDDGPHVIHVDMGKENTFNGIYINSVRTPNPQFRPKHIVIDVSNDNIDYDTVLNYTVPQENADLKFRFDHQVKARYFRITVDEIFITGNFAENLVINELDILQ